MRLTNSGNFGIGINTPTSKLHVVGDFKLDGALKMPQFSDLTDPELRIIQVGQTGTLGVLNASALTHALYKYDCVQSASDPFPLPVWRSSTNGTAGILHTGMSCPAKVGIGTITPAYELHVNGTTQVNQKLIVGSISQVDAMVEIESFYNPGLAILAGNQTNVKALQVLNHNDLTQNIFNVTGQGEVQINYFGTNDAFSIGRESTNGSMFRVRSDGGIDVRYNDTFDPLVITNDNTNDRILIVRHDGSIYADYFGEFDPFKINNHSTNEELFKISPAGSLHVNYTGESDPFAIRRNSIDENIFNIGGHGGMWMHCGVDVAPITVRKSLTNETIFGVRSDGGVDMVITSENSPLMIRRGVSQDKILEVGNFGDLHLHYSDDQSNPFSIKNTATDHDMFVCKPNGGVGLFFDHSSNDLAFSIHDAVTNDDIFIIAGDGKVYCQGIVVKLAPFWGDYVFEENHHRMSLSDLEKYIQENKHLPDFPTAKKISEEGADVYELLRLLTVKVEELTLYAIDQQKEIESLKAEVLTHK